MVKNSVEKILSAFNFNFPRIIRHTLQASLIETRIGHMIALADNNSLFLLEFLDRANLKQEIEALCKSLSSTIAPGDNSVVKSINYELRNYFLGERDNFKTKITLIGTELQQTIWKELDRIPYGKTKTYGDIAKEIKKPRASRAVGRTNSCNKLAIIIPCHRVIHANGKLGGYAGGVKRKEWLLQHEKQFT